MKLNKTILTYITVPIIISFVFARLQDNFLLSFIDTLSILSGLMLAYSLAVYLYKDGVFSFFTWKDKSKSYSSYRNQLREERKKQDNPAFLSGLILVIISILLTVYYMYFN